MTLLIPYGEKVNNMSSVAIYLVFNYNDVNLKFLLTHRILSHNLAL